MLTTKLFDDMPAQKIAPINYFLNGSHTIVESGEQIHTAAAVAI